MLIALRSLMGLSVLSVVWACVITGSRAARSNSSRRIADLGSGVDGPTAEQLPRTAAVHVGRRTPNTAARPARMIHWRPWSDTGGREVIKEATPAPALPDGDSWSRT